MPAVVCVFLCVQGLHTDTYTLPVSSCLVDCDRKYSPTCSSSLSKMQSCRCRAEYLAGYLPLLSFSPLPSFHFLLFVPPLRFVTAPSVSLPIPFGLPFVTTPPPPCAVHIHLIFSLFGSLLPLFPPFSYFCHSVFWLHSRIQCFLRLLFSLYSVFLQSCLLHCIVSSPSHPSCLSLIPLSCLLTFLSFHLLPSLFGLFYFLSGNILKYMFFNLSFIFYSLFFYSLLTCFLSFSSVVLSHLNLLFHILLLVSFNVPSLCFHTSPSHHSFVSPLYALLSSPPTFHLFLRFFWFFLSMFLLLPVSLTCSFFSSPLNAFHVFNYSGVDYMLKMRHWRANGYLLSEGNLGVSCLRCCKVSPQLLFCLHALRGTCPALCCEVCGVARRGREGEREGGFSIGRMRQSLWPCTFHYR